MNHDFEDIAVKRDAALILETQLRHKRKRVMIGTGAMCDPYTHLEDKLQATRQCLNVIEKYGFGLAIQTKSDRILRDIEILQSINQNAKCVVQITLTTYDEDLCRKIEPQVSTTLERFHILKAMQAANIPTVVWICPILPFLNDSRDNLAGLLDLCIEAQVRGILCFGFGVTMREGNREYFYAQLDKQFPGIKQKYIRQFGNAYSCNSQNNAQLMELFQTKCRRHNILYQVNDVFAYLRKFESPNQQLSLF
jgi:DNA repair photolyase